MADSKLGITDEDPASVSLSNGQAETMSADQTTAGPTAEEATSKPEDDLNTVELEAVSAAGGTDVMREASETPCARGAQVTDQAKVEINEEDGSTATQAAAQDEASVKEERENKMKEAKAGESPKAERVKSSRRDDWRKKGNQFNPGNLPESSDPEAIRNQVEFYFSDSNLPMDQFLMKETGGHENKPVPIKVIHNFKRMRHFQPYSAVVKALSESRVLEVNDKEEIRRRVPLPKTVSSNITLNKTQWEDKSIPLSIYAKGFGEESPSTQFDIEAFFGLYGPIKSVRLRRTFPEKTFKGSVFVEFDTIDLQAAFLTLDPKPKWKGQELLIMSKREYVDKKAADVAAGRIPSNERRQHSTRGENRGDDKKRDWKKRRDDFQRSDDFRRGGARGRGRGRGGRDRDGGRFNKRKDRDEEKAAASPKKAQIERDAMGVPIVRSTAPSKNGSCTGGDKLETVVAGDGCAGKELSSSQLDAPSTSADNSKKRAHEESGVAGQHEAKKAKVDNE